MHGTDSEDLQMLHIAYSKLVCHQSAITNIFTPDIKLKIFSKFFS